MKSKGFKVRINCLKIYDEIVKGHDLSVTELCEDLALKYYKEINPVKPFKKIRNDLLLAALATFYELDLVISEDRKTLVSKEFVKAFEKVNNRNNLNTPDFYSLKNFYKLF